jgi:EamA domain-containing membrane protein RarD
MYDARGSRREANREQPAFVRTIARAVSGAFFLGHIFSATLLVFTAFVLWRLGARAARDGLGTLGLLSYLASIVTFFVAVFAVVQAAHSLRRAITVNREVGRTDRSDDV